MVAEATSVALICTTVLVALGVAGLNYLIYAAILLLVPACPPVLATGIASVLSMLVSYAGYGRFAFRRA